MQYSSFAAFAALSTFLTTSSAFAAENPDIQALKSEIHAMRHTYESRIAELENKLAKMEQAPSPATPPTTPTPSAPLKGTARTIRDNSFNPSIGVILNGQYGNFSEKSSDIAGFSVGEEGGRAQEGLSLGESEINFSANVDDMFYGSLTTSLVREEGEDKIELEEAYVQTLPGTHLPKGLTLKAGRALWTLGYLNEHHAHADDFADRPLPYRVFLNNSYNDDGMEASYILPTDLYAEIGGGVFRGDDFPFGNGSGGGINAWSGFARIGGDIGDNQSWRLGGYVLSGSTDQRISNEETLSFAGDTTLYATDLRYSFAPTGNSREQEVLLQGEYFVRGEDGTYEDATLASGPSPVDDYAHGFYAQAVYKFLPAWRVGARYSRLIAPNAPSDFTGSVLDAGGHDPEAFALMADWTHSEFSRVRLQYNHEALSEAESDHQLLLQYVMSIGAHGAHKY